ncbi:MAG: universal stress protein [Halobacteriovoraceae bacterium]|nr:universal stress protein [Halobacteriovoraceae bacterium]MCB9093928.1 universal stress protein [Halobacteriovoraceae bacterium]
MREHIVCFPMNDEVLQNKVFDGIKKHNLHHNAKLHFVHVFKEEKYPYIVPPYIYPSPDQKAGIKSTIEDIMKKMVDGFISDGETSGYEYTCLFSEDPKIELENFINKHKYSTVILATRGKKGIEGLFTSSFADYMIKHSPYDVLVLR